MTRTNEAQYFVLHGNSTRKAPKEEFVSTETSSVSKRTQDLKAEFSFPKPPFTSQRVQTTVIIWFQFWDTPFYVVHFR
jgi:hypothetical protein